MVVGPPENWHLSNRVHQATGMIAAQVHCDTSEALARLKTRSAARGQTLDETALDVLDRVVRFDE
jgi:AmiR/NasT family two-component response regulator